MRRPPFQGSYDVVVVGAGPAGSCAAREASRAGARVLLVDRRRHIGVPARCAGFLPLAAASQLEGFGLAGSVRVRTMRSFFPDGSVTQTASPGLIVPRDRLDQWLASQAELAGAQLISGTWALDLETGGPLPRITLLTPDGPEQVSAAAIIGADGPRSRTGAAIGARNRELVAAAQWSVPLTPGGSQSCGCETRIYLDTRFPGGYGWLFPAAGLQSTAQHSHAAAGSQARLARVGVGVAKDSGASLPGALKWLIEKLAGEGLIEPRRLSATGGLLPAGGPLKPRLGTVLLAGDAAGLCHPVTGAGIWAAMLSGSLAGEAAAAAVGGSGNPALAGFDEEMEEIFGPALWPAAMKRKAMSEISPDDSPEAFGAALRQAWLPPAPASAGR